MDCKTVFIGMVNQGAWAVESVCTAVKTEKINEFIVNEIKEDVFLSFT